MPKILPSIIGLLPPSALSGVAMAPSRPADVAIKHRNTGGMTSEGVGSYWPFATENEAPGQPAPGAIHCCNSCYTLTPNQHGVWKVDFMPVARA